MEDWNGVPLQSGVHLQSPLALIHPEHERLSESRLSATSSSTLLYY